ncbi:MAG TPA: alpha/beta fold hydrolase, partial [Polyangiales bacterium]|nr:alpha/beta fold hydrolase [Polyangiales bacterium]
MSAPRPLWFGKTRGELFGMYHSPAADGGRRSLGIVLCNPFGYEAMCTHRAYWHLAEQLSRRGFPVLRFDYHGTGDSSGHDREPARLATWRDDVRRAIDELRRISGCSEVGLVGLRLGANLAMLAAEGRSDVRLLALWAPFFTGKAFLREELAVHKLRALENMAEPAAAVSGGRTNGEIEALGFVISAETHAALNAHTLVELGALDAQAALVLSRETSLQEPRVAARLGELGVAVESAAVEGYARMIDGGAPPMAAWSRIVDFFVRESELRADAAIANEPEILQASRDVWDGSADESPIEETACYFGPGHKLFGVISHARTRISGEPAPAVLLLSGGFNHHVGQNRMYTRWARNWAAMGVTCLRFDLAGFGDSRVDAGETDGVLHSLEATEDVRAAMDHLAAIGGSPSFAIVGLCSGAFIGFYAALDDDRVTSLAQLNWTRFYPDTVAPTMRSQYRALRFYWAALTRRRTWQKLLRGAVDVQGVTKHFLRSVTRRVRARLPLLA